MEGQSKKVTLGVIGGVLGVIGLVLFAIWWRRTIWLVISALPLVFLGLGVQMILKAFGTSWQDLILCITRTAKEIVTPAQSSSYQRTIGVTIQCPKCGAKILEGTKFCLHCGNPLPQPKICLKCQKVNAPEAVFCGYCGTEL